MRRSLGAAALLLAACTAGLVTQAFAGNPATITVTVTIQNLSVSATGPIAFGTVVASTQTVRRVSGWGRSAEAGVFMP